MIIIIILLFLRRRRNRLRRRRLIIWSSRRRNSKLQSRSSETSPIMPSSRSSPYLNTTKSWFFHECSHILAITCDVSPSQEPSSPRRPAAKGHISPSTSLVPTLKTPRRLGRHSSRSSKRNNSNKFPLQARQPAVADGLPFQLLKILFRSARLSADGCH